MAYRGFCQVLTTNVRGVKTNAPKLHTFYKDFQHPKSLKVAVLTETNLDITTLRSESHLPPSPITAFTTRDPAKQNSSTGSGVTFLFGGGVPVTPDSFQSLIDGYLGAINFEYQSHNVLLFGVYSPPANTRRAEEIVAAIHSHAESTTHTHLIVAGDLNAGLRPSDRSSGVCTPQDRVWQKFVQERVLTDIMAHKFPDSPRYTRTKGHSKSALDHILLSPTLVRSCHRADVVGGSLKVSDHYVVKGTLGRKISIASHAPTVTRIPSRDLHSGALDRQVASYIAANPPPPEDATPQSVMAWWVRFKYGFGACITDFTIQRARRDRQKLYSLQDQLQKFRDTVPLAPPEVDDTQVSQLEAKLNAAIKDQEHKIQSYSVAHINSCAGFDTSEDSYSARVLASRKLDGNDRNALAFIHPQTGSLEPTTMGMLEANVAFYTDLLGSPPDRQDPTIDSADKQWSDLLTSPALLTVPPQEGDQATVPVTLKETKGLFTRLRAHRAPGSDGIGNDIYKTFDMRLVQPFMRVIQAFQQDPKSLPPSMLEAIISPFYKGKGDRADLRNWRPITLVNTDYKLLAMFLAGRLLPLMRKLVGPGQTSAVPGRTTFDNIHAVRLALAITQLKQVDAAFIFVDSEKAFDRVEWEYLWGTLRAQGIPPHVVSMIKALYQGSTVRIRVNGHLTCPIELGRGVRQGCPLSPLLYVLSLEPIRAYIQDKVPNETLLWMPCGVPSSFAHADDLTVIIDHSQAETFIDALMHNKGIRDTGFKVNTGKSTVLLVLPPAPGETEIAGIPAYHYLDHEYIHLGLPIGGPDPEGAARKIATDRFVNKVALLRPCNLPILEKSRLLVSRYGGQLQFYGQTVAISLKLALSFKRILREAVYTRYPRNYIKEARLFMPRHLGGAGLLDPPAWLECFRHDQLLRLQRAVQTPDDPDKRRYTDETYVILFKHLVKVATPGQGGFDPATFFYQEPSMRNIVREKLPEYWQMVLDYFNDKFTSTHSVLDRTVHPFPDIPLEEVLCQYSPLFEIPPEWSLYCLAPTFEPDATYGPVYSMYDPFAEADGSPQVPLSLTGINMPTSEISSRLELYDPWTLQDAYRVINHAAFMLPLHIESPEGKRRVHSLYLSNRFTFFNTHPVSSPDQEWATSLPFLRRPELETPRLDQRYIVQALTFCHGRYRPQLKSHAWLLYQGRLSHVTSNCGWCHCVLPKNSADRFLHESWTCPTFSRHWHELSFPTHVRAFNNIYEIALGVSLQNGFVTKISKSDRLPAIALHTALWRHRSPGHINYHIILKQFKYLSTMISYEEIYMHTG